MEPSRGRSGRSDLTYETTVATKPRLRYSVNVAWVLLAYRLPREPSTPRIALWRNLRRLGAVQLVDGLVALPRDSGTQEQLEWLADDIAAAGGDATIWFVEAGSSLRDGRSESAHVRVGGRRVPDDHRGGESGARERRCGKTADAGATTARVACGPLTRLLPFTRARTRDACRRGTRRARGVAVVKWATRRHCHVDRTACAWLIRRFVDPEATFVFVDDPDDIPADATAFDVRGVELSHHGGDCSFETFLKATTSRDPALDAIARIVHEADIGDERFDAPEAAGLDSVIRGLSLVIRDDDDLLLVSAPLFDGLYELALRSSALEP